jgi:hypothetical protein
MGNAFKNILYINFPFGNCNEHDQTLHIIIFKTHGDIDKQGRPPRLQKQWNF